MARLLHRLALGVQRRRWTVISVWVLVLAAVIASAALFAKPTQDSFSIPGLESTDALTTAAEVFPGGIDSGEAAGARVVLEAPEGTSISDPDNAAAVAALVAELQDAPQVTSVSDPFAEAAPTVSPDLAAAYVTVGYDVAQTEVTPEARAALFAAADDAEAAGLTAAVGGTATTNPTALGGVAEIAGVLVAVLVLLITFGTLLPAGLNLLTALVGVGIGAAGVTAATALVDLSSTTSIIALMLGLAVGIDYGLFLLTRVRQELVAGREVREAVALATGTAGSAVVVAGTTVVIALAGLTVVGIPFLSQMGLAAAATVTVAVLVALTLLPAVLSLAGTRVLSRRQRRTLAAGTAAGASPAGARPRGHAADRGWAARWGSAVTRHPVVGLLGIVVVLATLAVPLASLQTSLGDDTTAPEGSSPRVAADLIAEHWGPGVNGPLLVLVQDAPGTATVSAADLGTAITGLDDVATVLPATPNADDSAALLTVLPASGPSTEATQALVQDIRDLRGTTGATIAVTGSTAVNVDVSEKLSSALPVYLAIVVGLALVLLVLIFRSVLVPVTAVLGFLLTVGSALGATTAVFQWGWLGSLVGSDSTGPLLSLAPVIVVGILFGLAMDYQVFLVSRMHEAVQHGTAPRAAVVAGFRSAAPVVLAAATIMISVFGGFVPEGDATIKPIAFALAFGVLVDAVLVRMVAVPAALTLLGGAAWWLPRWLRWLPQIDVEGRALEQAAAGRGAHRGAAHQHVA